MGQDSASQFFLQYQTDTILIEAIHKLQVFQIHVRTVVWSRVVFAYSSRDEHCEDVAGGSVGSREQEKDSHSIDNDSRKPAVQRNSIKVKVKALKY